VAAVVVSGVIGALLKLVLTRSPLIQFGIATLAFGEADADRAAQLGRLHRRATGKYGVQTKVFGISLDTPREYFWLALGSW